MTRAALISLLLSAPAAFAETGILSLGGYGVICEITPDGQRTAPGTVSGVLNVIDQTREIDVITDRVPAELGLSFGIRAEMTDGATGMSVDVVVTHPPMGDSGQTVEIWDTWLAPDDSALNLFSFEAPFELIEGPWLFQMMLDGEVLLEKAFVVTPAGTVPEVQSTCHGAMILS